MPSNPVALTIPANAKGVITAVSNAGYYQRATAYWDQYSALLQGTGEGVAMTTPAGATTIAFPPSAQGYQLLVLFEFSSSGPSGPFAAARTQQPIVSQSGPFTITQVKSEDGGDNDFNDTYLTLVVISLNDAAAAQPVAAEVVAQTADAQLELHAKTCYNDPSIQGCDEHSFIIPSFTGQFGTLSYNGQSWSGRNASCYNDATPFGGYLYTAIQLYNCTHMGMHNRTVDLWSTISYWGSMPTGYRSGNWEWSVGGTGDYTVTEVKE